MATQLTKKKVAAKKSTIKKTAESKSSKEPKPAQPKVNVCDAVRRILKKAKKETPAIRSLRAWHTANC